jgi:hypothetical protein
MTTKDYGTMRALVESAKGRFCAVDFIKRDGSLRRMIVQPAALKFHIKGSAASLAAQKRNEAWKANNPNLMPVWDVEKEAIRSINFDTVQRIAIDGEVYNYG